MKKLFHTILLFAGFITTTSRTSAQGWQWERHIVNTPFAVSSRQSALTTDTAGNVFSAIIVFGFSELLGGVTSTFGTQSIVDSTDAAQLIITKTDPHGNVMWAAGTQHVGTGVTNISTDKEGNAYVLGVYDSANGTLGGRSLGHGPLPVPNNTMYFIAKLNPAGQVVWVNNVVATSSFGYGSGAMAITYLPHGSIRADDSGHLYVCGNFISSGLSIGGTALTLHGDQSIFIAKYDTSGTPLWAKTYGSTGGDYVFNTGLTSTGELFMAGAYYADAITLGPVTLNNTAGRGSFLAKFDNGGNAVWAKTTDTFVYIWDVALDTMANAYICGSFTAGTVSFGGHSITNAMAGNANAFIAKYAADGTDMWARSFGSDSSETAEKITVDHCGNIFSTGTIGDIHAATTGYDLNFDGNTHHLTVSSFADHPLFIAHYDVAGNYVNCVGLYGGGVNQPRITADNKGHFYINTQYTNPDTLGANILMRDSGQFYQYIARFDYDSVGCVLYSELAVEDITTVLTPEIQLFPNPANATFFLVNNEGFNNGATASLLDMAGRQVISIPLNGKTVTIPLQGIAPGVYNCIINMRGAGVVYKKVVITP